jgi:hypothetical protein
VDFPTCEATIVSSIFDIFRLEEGESLIWCEAADTLDSAKARVGVLSKIYHNPKYVILDQRTQKRVMVNRSFDSSLNA